MKKNKIIAIAVWVLIPGGFLVWWFFLRQKTPAGQESVTNPAPAVTVETGTTPPATSTGGTGSVPDPAPPAVDEDPETPRQLTQADLVTAVKDLSVQKVNDYLTKKYKRIEGWGKGRVDKWLAKHGEDSET